MSRHKNIDLLERTYIGQMVNYRNREFKILTYKQEKELITIVTDDQQWIKTNVYDLGVLLDEMDIVIQKEIASIKKKFDHVPIFFAVKNEAVERSQKVLLKTLDDIESGEINAERINSIVNITEAIIKTEKIKIEMLNSMNNSIKQ